MVIHFLFLLRLFTPISQFGREKIPSPYFHMYPLLDENIAHRACKPELSNYRSEIRSTYAGILYFY
jgi:hypothetical protein